MLLKSKPEQERRLLSALVNKLGDPERKVASNASYLLSSLLTVHPNMKRVVIEEVDSFLFRPHLSTRARYYAAVFLNQIVLSNRGDEPVIAAKLINLYFALFQTVTTGEPKEDYDQKTKKGKQPDKRRKKESGQSKKKEVQFSVVAEADSRILSALLTGVNRAFPYVAADDVDVIIEQHTPVLFRLVHSSNFNVAVQALMLLHQLMLKNQAVSERFYRALYAILLSSSLTKSSKAEMFLGLLFKALKSDINSDRMSAFAKRLTQVALHQPPQFACGCLLLLSEILKTRPSLWNGILQPEDQDEETEHFVDIPEDTDEVNPSQPIPDGQIVGFNSTEDGIIADGELGEESKSDSDIGDKEKLGGSIPDLGEDNSDSSDEEDSRRSNQEAAMGEESELLMPDINNKLATRKKEKIIEAQFSAGAAISGDRNEQLPRKRVWPLEGCYDPRHREPSYCHAERACWWELSALAIHMHPSVASMARTLLSGANIVYSGDPLRDLVLGAFLDRFAEKKPKARKQSEDGTFQGSALPLPIKMVTNARLVGAELLALDESEVAPDDVVFHKFYQTKSMKSRSKSSKKKKTSKDDEDDITGMGDEDGQLVDGDDSDDEEVDALLEKDEGLAMGLKGDDALDDEDTEDFDYDKLGEAFELEDEDESDGELQKVNTDNNIAEPDASGSSANEWSQSDDDLDLEEPAESESDVDSLDSIEIGDLPSDTDEEGVAVKAETRKGSIRTKTKKIVTKARKRKPGRKGEPELGGRQKTKLKSPFASVQEYAHLLEDVDASEKVSKAKGKRVRRK
jgi:ribosome biogenesis protein MAK21